ncbi:transcriptional activator domain-containing protein [Actinoplanes sp. TBRC 11911]|uniref:BTAD domain-containing putative transcriptional regulator n=1 Tax=Actinoplanes sp. TBRC 11911 TaxID=2729386 RepID=UPI00145FBBDF|nr:BTAD domain-containing putative transcriptional regulator [Actinoplanes sp. TBRC 11911]NMO49606.1 transcriptional activator domain-containing protein [Actinoplanes sp. TBRC 11911]
MLTVAVLGPVDLRRDGVPVAVPAGKTTELLIRLALEAGRPVRAERLIEDLWAGEAVGVARNTLQVKVSKLRRALGDPALLGGGPAGYTLHVGPEAVDALRALRLEPGAFTLFDGDEILPDAGDGDWAVPWRARLEQARLTLAEAHYADAGGADIGELDALVTAYPTHEGLWQLLVAAWYRDGRAGEALEAYRRARSSLMAELGIEPGPGLRDLHQRILAQAPLRGNLPALTAPLIGRDADRTALSGLLATHRLVTLVGPAGVGKTRLAVDTARGEGGWLVRLESAGPIWQAIGEALDLPEATEAMVLDRLRGHRTLLVLDNCEHLVDRLIPVVERLLSDVAGLTMLATSQVPLGLPGETTYAVEPLPPDDAARLFRERASRHRAIGPDEDVAAVCRALDGLPLAIELAAARAKALPVPEIARRLDDRFALLTDPASRRPARQRTLSAAIGWSYDLLFPDDQRGLWALSCFAGGAPLAGAEHVLAALDVPAPAALDALDRLVDRSLATAEVTGDAVRYRLLDSVRDYGRGRAHAAGAGDLAAGAHAAWYAAAAAGADSRGPGQGRHLAFVRAERADIDAAVAWAVEHDPVLALRIVNGFGWAWIFLGAGAEAARRSRAVLAAAGPDAAVEDRVDALLFAGWFEASGGDLDRAFVDVRAARQIAPLPRTGLFLAFLHTQQGRPAEALDALPVLDGWEAGAGKLIEAWASIALGDVGRARAACDEARRVLDDAWALAHAEALLGGLAQAEHRYAEAVAHLSRAADAAEQLGFGAASALHLANLGRAQQQNGSAEAALATLDRAAAAAGTAGDLRTVALARTRRARVLRAVGRIGEARAELRIARDWYASAGGGDGDLLSAQLTALIDGDAAGLERVLAAARAAGDGEVEMLALDALARITGDPRLRAEADALRPAVRHLVTDADLL